MKKIFIPLVLFIKGMLIAAPSISSISQDEKIKNNKNQDVEFRAIACSYESVSSILIDFDSLPSIGFGIACGKGAFGIGIKQALRLSPNSSISFAIGYSYISKMKKIVYDDKKTISYGIGFSVKLNKVGK